MNLLQKNKPQIKNCKLNQIYTSMWGFNYMLSWIKKKSLNRSITISVAFLSDECSEIYSSPSQLKVHQ